LLILIFSSSISLLLFYLQLPLQIQYAVIISLIVILIFLQRFLPLEKKLLNSSPVIWLFFFCSSLMIQLLVMSTGGVYSSFFVLLHLYALAIGFFIGLAASLFFLFISAITLMAQIGMDP